MSKAVLVMEMPFSCGMCIFAKKAGYATGDLYCNNPLATLRGNYVSGDIMCKPDWCPLKPLPGEKKITRLDEGSDWLMGYNACLYEITKERE